MTVPASTPRTTSRIAIMVMDPGSRLVLSPFFGKCDGILLIDADTVTTTFLRNPSRTSESVCDSILAAKPDRLVCGFIAEPEKRKLQAAGVDVRLGSCTFTLDQFVASFCVLPEA